MAPPDGSNPPAPYRIGHGYDLHRLEPLAPGGEGKPLILGGIRFDHDPGFDRGPVGHSDGDALLHAITDAILGALALPDIGTLFPDSDPANKGRDSAEFLDEAMRRCRDAGYRVSNLDGTVVLERPRVIPRKSEMVQRIASLVRARESDINVKGKTHERVDAIGEGRAVEAYAVALLIRA